MVGLSVDMAVAVGDGNGAWQWAQPLLGWPVGQFVGGGAVRCKLNRGWLGLRLAAKQQTTVNSNKSSRCTREA